MEKLSVLYLAYFCTVNGDLQNLCSDFKSFCVTEATTNLFVQNHFSFSYTTQSFQSHVKVKWEKIFY